MTHKPIPRRSDLPGQLEIPGTNPSLSTLASAPLKPSSPQKPCDLGLFSDEADQLDLVTMLL